MPDPAAQPPPTTRSRLKKGVPDGPPGAWVVVAAWGPCGFVPLAPGTAGTIGAVPLFWALRALPLGLYVLTTAALTALAVFAAAGAGRYWKAVDASPIVIDEVVGYLVTMALAPSTWQGALLGFVLFRIFDVLKPWPASFFDRKVKNGFGVVMDDVMAGVWGLVAMQLITHALRTWAGCASGGWYCLELAR